MLKREQPTSFILLCPAIGWATSLSPPDVISCIRERERERERESFATQDARAHQKEDGMVSGHKATSNTRPLGKVGRHSYGAAYLTCLVLSQDHHPSSTSSSSSSTSTKSSFTNTTYRIFILIHTTPFFNPPYFPQCILYQRVFFLIVYPQLTFALTRKNNIKGKYLPRTW